MNDPVNVQIARYAWDPDTQADAQTDYITVSWLERTGPNTGHWCEQRCHTPEQLWTFLFNFEVPEYKPQRSLPTNLEDLFK